MSRLHESLEETKRLTKALNEETKRLEERISMVKAQDSTGKWYWKKMREVKWEKAEKRGLTIRQWGEVTGLVLSFIVSVVFWVFVAVTVAKLVVIAWGL